MLALGSVAFHSALRKTKDIMIAFPTEINTPNITTLNTTFSIVGMHEGHHICPSALAHFVQRSLACLMLAQEKRAT